MHVERQQERLVRAYAGVSATGELDSQLDLGLKFPKLNRCGASHLQTREFYSISRCWL